MKAQINAFFEKVEYYSKEQNLVEIDPDPDIYDKADELVTQFEALIERGISDRNNIFITARHFFTTTHKKSFYVTRNLRRRQVEYDEKCQYQYEDSIKTLSRAVQGLTTNFLKTMVIYFPEKLNNKENLRELDFEAYNSLKNEGFFKMNKNGEDKKAQSLIDIFENHKKYHNAITVLRKYNIIEEHSKALTSDSNLGMIIMWYTALAKSPSKIKRITKVDAAKLLSKEFQIVIKRDRLSKIPSWKKGINPKEFNKDIQAI